MLRDLDGNAILNLDVLQSSLDADCYKTASPFPHISIDNLFCSEALDRILREWALEATVEVESHDDGTYVRKKRATTHASAVSPYTEFFFSQLSKPEFLKYLEELSGLWGLIPDPYLFGGGLHETGDGGKLSIHADYNKHFIYKLNRRLNLLIYLNKDWQEHYGGALELWDREVTECVRRIEPHFNRTVIFTTSSTSFHGHPDPMNLPPGVTRRSMAFYYFSNGTPDLGEVEVNEHSTIWAERPDRGF